MRHVVLELLRNLIRLHYLKEMLLVPRLCDAGMFRQVCVHTVSLMFCLCLDCRTSSMYFKVIAVFLLVYIIEVGTLPGAVNGDLYCYHDGAAEATVSLNQALQGHLRRR